ncbi:MAG TPA: response regulator [Saprospiraceae bacterium]|nr:response regulator [Saprospiraceae bacterium]
MADNKTILVIEDNNDVRENIAEILTLSSYNVLEAQNGKIGVEMAIKNKPDLIICDIMMPELDGFGVLRIINRNPDTMDIPFLFLTAKTEKEDFRKGMILGADDYITKPFDDVELLDAIEMRIKKSERIKQIPINNKENIISSFINLARGEEILKSLLTDKETRKYHKKDQIVEVGQYPKYLYYIISGWIKLSNTNDLGKELIYKLIKENEFFGFESIILDTPYNESAIAMEDTEVYLIPKEEFLSIINKDRDVSARLIKLMADNSFEKTQQLLDIAYSSVRRKVANALLTLSESQGQTITILRDDLAAIAGTAKETVIRTLSDFKTEKIIDIRDNVIVILDKVKLINMPV